MRLCALTSLYFFASQTEVTVDEEGGASPVDSGYTSNDSATPDRDTETLMGDIDQMHITDDELKEALSDLIQLSVTNEDDRGESKQMIFEKASTVADVIEQSIGTENADDYELEVNGRVLQRNMTLRDAGFLNGSQMRIGQRKFKIFIRRVDGRSSTMDVRASDTIQDVKEQFFYTDQVPVHQQRLLFQSKELENTRTLRFYGIKANSSLEMVYRLRGGN